VISQRRVDIAGGLEGAVEIPQAAVVLHFVELVVDGLHRGQGALDGDPVRRDADAVRIGQLLELAAIAAWSPPQGCARRARRTSSPALQQNEINPGEISIRG
jgi:hypothetical protein